MLSSEALDMDFIVPVDERYRTNTLSVSLRHCLTWKRMENTLYKDFFPLIDHNGYECSLEVPYTQIEKGECWLSLEKTLNLPLKKEWVGPPN